MPSKKKGPEPSGQDVSGSSEPVAPPRGSARGRGHGQGRSSAIVLPASSVGIPREARGSRGSVNTPPDPSVGVTPRGRAIGGSSRPAELPPTSSDVSGAVEQLARMTLPSEAGPSQVGSRQARQEAEPQEVPESLRSLSLKTRPNFGTIGAKVLVRTNYYLARCTKDFLYKHDVTIKETPSRGEGEVSSKFVRRAVIRELVRLQRSSALNNALPAFDGNKILFTASKLPKDRNEFEILLPEDSQSTRERRFKVVITAVVNGRIDMSRLQQSASMRDEPPQDAINALDTVLRETPTLRETPAGRSFFRPPQPNFLREAALGAGLEAWKGYYQSVRPIQSGLALNLDLSTTAFYQAVDVLAFLADTMMGRGWDPRSRAISDAERIRVRKLLRGLLVETKHNPHVPRKYRVADISRTSATQTMFELEGHGAISVAQYFERHYQYCLQYPNLPCITAASNKAMLPLEVCRLLSGQRCQKKLSDDQIRRMLGITQRRPDVRARDTQETFKSNGYDRDAYAREFGIAIDGRMMEVESRILPPPMLTYANMEVTPENGVWRMERRAKFVDGIKIPNWTLLNFGAVDRWAAAELGASLARKCNEGGMYMNPQPILPPRDVTDTEASDSVQLLHLMQTLFSDVTRAPAARGIPLQLVVCLFPHTNAGLYACVKRLSVVEVGFVTQVCLAKHLAGDPRRNRQGPSPVYLSNLALKINVKVASSQSRRIGCNFTFAETEGLRLFSGGDPRKAGKPTIVFGADVSHPPAGEDALSIAAVVASQDWPYQGRYRAISSTQEKHQEILQMMQENVRELLLSFYQATKVQPEQIIMYRDGVSEGQFLQVLLRELDAIFKACASLSADYRPQVTFVVVQKRHHTRLFPTGQVKDRSGNVPAGSVVDTGITHPCLFDFFLNSHAGLLGTSRPTRYIVLYDENNFSADAMQALSNALCYTYARCTRAVSIVPPVYYSHLAALQARCFVDPSGSDRGSASSSAAGSVESHRAARPVAPMPGLRPQVVNTMYFC